MARVENCSEPYTRLKRLYPAVSLVAGVMTLLDAFHSHDTVHLVIYYMTGLPKVDRVDDFIVAILFIAIEILGLTAVTRVVEEERVVRVCVFHQPVHSS